VLVLPRYLDPTNERDGRPRGRAWAGRATTVPEDGLVDVYVGGRARGVASVYGVSAQGVVGSWHVSKPEPFQRLVNQGYILAPAYQDERGSYVEATEVEERDGRYFADGVPVQREFGKMGKSLKNAVAPDDIYRDYGADTLRLYEMFMGPLDASRPWSTTDIIGVHRFLQRLWRNMVDEDSATRRSTTTRSTRETKTAAAAHDPRCGPTWPRWASTPRSRGCSN
jgi:leucyl-tRNA synthetase